MPISFVESLGIALAGRPRGVGPRTRRLPAAPVGHDGDLEVLCLADDVLIEISAA
jgi:hypothetical protein